MADVLIIVVFQLCSGNSRYLHTKSFNLVTKTR